MWADPRGGYAILGLLVLGVLGATLAPGGIRNRQRAPQRILAAALLLGAALSLLWPSLRARVFAGTRTPDSNRSPIGTWTYATDTLTVGATGWYVCRGQMCTGLGQRGTWRIGTDGELVVKWSDGPEVSWRMVRYNGHDRLGLAPSAGAGASWDTGLSFMRVSP